MIRPPRLLLAAGLLFWGWFSGFLVAGVAMAVTIEAAGVVRVRWDLSQRDFERIADLCTVAFVGALVFQLVQSREFPDSLIAALVWLPMLFFALVLSQTYSTARRVPMSALFWSLRQRTAARKADRRAGQTIELDYGYFCLCLLSACTANPRSHWFLSGLTVLAICALWPARPKRGTGSSWVLALVAAVAVGFTVQAGVLKVQGQLEEWVFDWLSHRWKPSPDPYQSRTAIGDIGMLKASDRIVVRVKALRGAVPQRLRAATYTTYAGSTWTAPGQVFTPITPDSQTWVLFQGSGARVQISSWLQADHALLALPLGTFRLDALNASAMQQNGLGTVRIEQAPDMLLFDAHFDSQRALDAAPTTVDLTLPSSLRPALDKVAKEIALPERDPVAAAHSISEFFDTRFGYSLTLARRDGSPRSLSQFLLDDRRGHCEYFATATVLLLRHAGVPARYATGYAVQEWSALEQQYVVRMRHAHAWALAWIEGRWQEVDTTPAVWTEQEAEEASVLQPLYDVLSLLNYRLALWQLAPSDDATASTIMMSIAGVLALYLAWRVWRRGGIHILPNKRADPSAARATANPQVAALLQTLAKLGYQRPPGAALLRWVRDLPLLDMDIRLLLESAVRGYYRDRFDPLGVTLEERELSDRRIETLVHRLASQAPRRNST